MYITGTDPYERSKYKPLKEKEALNKIEVAGCMSIIFLFVLFLIFAAILTLYNIN